MDYGRLTVSEIKQGYRLEKETSSYICNYCGTVIPQSHETAQAASGHITSRHGGNARQLIHSDTKYNQLTIKQRELLESFNAGLSDAEIAKKFQVSLSTIRRHKFNFREKAKQAKLYLAMFENVFENMANGGESIIPIHNHAKYYDERYIITEDERKKILNTSFESMEPLKLKNFSPKEKKKVVILTKIAEQFEHNKIYTEKEVNNIIKPIYEDYVTIRRYLIMYGFMDREKDGSKYWLT